MDQHIQILVVDDDKEDHIMLMDYFIDIGLSETVAFTDNGRRALDYLESIKDDRLLPNLVILDLNMPILSGTQTLQQMKQTPRLRRIPVIILSTSENENEKRKCLNFGAIDYLVKPISYEEGRNLTMRFKEYVKK